MQQYKIRASWRQSIHSKSIVCSHQQKFHLYLCPISTYNGSTLCSKMACWVCTLIVKVPLLHQKNMQCLTNGSMSNRILFPLGFSVVNTSRIKNNCRCAGVSIHLLIDCWLLICTCFFLQGLPVGCQVDFNLDFWGSASSSKPFPSVDCCVWIFKNIPSPLQRLQNILWGSKGTNDQHLY